VGGSRVNVAVETGLGDGLGLGVQVGEGFKTPAGFDVGVAVSGMAVFAQDVNTTRKAINKNSARPFIKFRLPGNCSPVASRRWLKSLVRQMADGSGTRHYSACKSSTERAYSAGRRQSWRIGFGRDKIRAD